MAPIPIWATTLMVQNETVYINIHMKLKNIFSNSNRYFVVLIHYVYILCIYIMYIYIYHIYILHYVIYIYIIYILHYVIYIYVYVIYIYIYQGFSYWEIGANTPTSQKFARSNCTWKNFFLHQKLVSSPINKNFRVINQ